MLEVSPVEGGPTAASRAAGVWWSESSGRRFGKNGDWRRTPLLERLVKRIQNGVFFLVWVHDPILEGCSEELASQVVTKITDACLSSDVDFVLEISPRSRLWRTSGVVDVRKDSRVVVFPWDWGAWGAKTRSAKKMVTTVGPLRERKRIDGAS